MILALASVKYEIQSHEFWPRKGMTSIPVTFTWPSLSPAPGPRTEGTQKERILLFPVLCCLEQALIGSFLFALSFNPNSQSVVTPRMWVPSVNFDRVLNYCNKQSIYELSTQWNNLGSAYNPFILA